MKLQKCEKCGQTLRRLMLLAMLQDLGAVVSQAAEKCVEDGGEHDFVEIEQEKTE